MRNAEATVEDADLNLLADSLLFGLIALSCLVKSCVKY